MNQNTFESRNLEEPSACWLLTARPGASRRDHSRIDDVFYTTCPSSDCQYADAQLPETEPETMQHTDLLPVPHEIELAEPEPEDAPDLAERVTRMLTAFRRPRSITAEAAEELRQRYRMWREQQLAPFVSVLADIVLRSIGVQQ
jgi:hypothetical protein